MDSEKARVWRTVSEKRRIVELTLQPGMSVARVAQAEGVNSHQVFQLACPNFCTSEID
jgi:transposase-like protein